MLAIATTLLLASIGASPARAQDAGTQPPDASSPGTPPPPPPVPAAPTAPSSSTSAPAAPSPPAVPDVPEVESTRPASSGTGNGGDLSSTQGGGSRVYSGDGMTIILSRPKKKTGTGGQTPVKSTADTNRAGPLAVDKTRNGRHAPAARSRDGGAKASPVGGVPGFGNQVPNQNPSVSLLKTTGGAAAGLALAGMLAILGAAFVLPRKHWTIFRLPAVSWRPSAYVSPIELPG